MMSFLILIYISYIFNYRLPEYNSIYIYLFIYLTAFCTASLLKTSWTDPGVVILFYFIFFILFSLLLLLLLFLLII